MGVLGVITETHHVPGDSTSTGVHFLVIETDDPAGLRLDDTVEIRLVRRDGDDVEHVSDREGILGWLWRHLRPAPRPASRTVTA